MGSTEVVIGTLRGMGYEVACTLLVSRADRKARAMRCEILDAPIELPDGYYEALFSDQSAFLRRGQGAWGVGIAWAAIPTRVKSEPDALPFVAEWTRTLAG
jgi:hypothetical protein